MVCGPSVAVLVLVLAAGTGAHRCNREPEGATSPRSPLMNRYHIQISGNQDKYAPGETYRVTLSGNRNGHVMHTFTGFTLAVESDSYYAVDSSARVGNMSTLGDALTMYGHNCPNTVVQTSTIPKSEVQVLWRAPASGSGCVRFRATVIEQPNVWYMDEGRLSLTLCESEQANHDKQPDIIETCCACDEAKYEMTFEGMWSRHTHPRDFPDNNWLTRFSDVIGASHTVHYNFWSYNGTASEGLRQVAEHGTTRALESELKAKSQHIRTIVKARGIGFPNVTGKTFAVFRVDHKHHLMSIVSMIYPSPDWIVGVSGLELCLKNCSWVESIMLNLYPWDVGTDSGETYMSEDSPTIPPEPIHRITSRDERSPFYDPDGADIKPLARIYLTRQRLYEKNCEDNVSGSITETSSQDSECATTPWKPESECPPTCGVGWRRSQRMYVNPDLAYSHGCMVRLTRREKCDSPACGKPDQSSESAELNPYCDVTDWSEWSECSSPCGGIQTRHRSYVNRMAQKACSILPDAHKLQQTMECDRDPEATDCDKDVEIVRHDVPNNCHAKKWSEWSPCSTTCGKGTRTRTRVVEPYNRDQYRTAAMHRLSNNEEEEDDDDGGVNEGDSSPELDEVNGLQDCSDIEDTQETKCEGIVSKCILTPEEAVEACTLPRKQGPCRSPMQRWFFNYEANTCEQFNFGGCRGNQNNFESLQECETVCQGVEEESTTAVPTTKDPLGGFSVHNRQWYSEYTSDGISTTAAPGEEDFPVDTPRTQDRKSPEKVNCRTTPWSAWSSCSATCGRSYRVRTREIVVYPKNGGKPCKRLRKKQKCTPVFSCEYTKKLQSDEFPFPGEEDLSAASLPVEDCRLSKWSAWSSCSMSCGPYAMKQRTRSIVVNPTPGGMPCGNRIETILCTLPRCKD